MTITFVSRLTADGIVDDHPIWDAVLDAIEALDAAEFTLVTLAPASPLGPPEGDHHMSIAGGKEGRCVVYLTEDNQTFWNLRDPTKVDSDRRIMMLIGGQIGDYREAQCVPKEWAIQAAEVYFKLGTRAPGLPWQQA